MYLNRVAVFTSLFLLLLAPSCDAQHALHNGDANVLLDKLNEASPRVRDSLHDGSHVLNIFRDVVGNLAKLMTDARSDELSEKLAEFAQTAEVNYNVSEKCMNATMSIFDDLAAGHQYAVKMLDASAKPPPGILGGNLRWTGAYDYCLNITTANKPPDSDFGGQYCMVMIDWTFVPASVTQGVPFYLTLGTCTPDSCSKDDVMHLMSAALSLLPSEKPIQSVMATCNTDPNPYSAGDIVALLLCSIFLLLAVFGTTFDLYHRYQQEAMKFYVNQNGDASIEDHEGVQDGSEATDGERLISYQKNKDASTETSTLQKFLLAFSFLKNADKIWDVSNTQREIQVLHGLRAVSMWWVILGHTHLFYVLNYDNLFGLFKIVTRWSFQAIGNATFSVDTFFFLSGLLVTFVTLKYMRANDGKMRWGMFYLHRYLRLTPVYMFCVLLTATLVHHLPEVPQGSEIIQDTCYKYWWANLLYINNFVPLDNAQMCFGWAWYLANDMQFFVISPLILIPLYKKPWLGFTIIAVLCLVCMGITGFISSYFHAFGPAFGLAVPKPRNLYPNAKGFDYIYGKPYTRICTYVIGMATGYVLFRTECKKEALKMNKIVAVIGWMLTWAVGLAVVYAFAYDMEHQVILSDHVLAFYTSVSRFAWGLCLAWVTIACVHGHGGPITTILEWKCWVPISRLTYCAYLLHPIWIFFHAGLMRTQFHYDDMTMVYFFIGNIVLSYGVAFVLSVLVEAPLLAVEKLVFYKT